MQTYSIEGNSNSPYVYMSKEERKINIVGNSTLKNTNWFYSNVLKWALAFNNEPEKAHTINIKLDRINDSSIKWLLIIFKKLAQLLPRHNFEINWYYTKADSKVERSGNRLKTESDLNVNLIGI